MAAGLAHRALNERRWITPEPLNVAPQLVGLPLAQPRQRALAMGLDLLVVALLSGVSGFWLVGGLALVVLQLRSRRGGRTGWRQTAGWVLAGLMALLAIQEAVDHWQHRRGAAVSPAKPAAEQAAEPDDEDLALKDVPGITDAQRVVLLKAALAEARKPRPMSLRGELDRVIDALGASFGWGIVYFSLLPAWWGGQTLGKKLLRIQALELTGKPMTVLVCLRRYGGYAAGMATGGLGFLQLLWDVNRQAIQDRTAHTVVVDLRASSSGASSAQG